eukprot:PITA_33624
MSTILDTFKLVDIPMNKKFPTWHNRRIGEAALGRRLDRFLIHEDPLDTLPLYRQWFGTGGSSYHLPIYLQISSPSKLPRAPYKLFTGYLKDPDFINLVTEFWRAQPPLREHRMAANFYVQLKNLSAMTKDWSRRKKLRDEQNLKDIELQIAQLTDDQGLRYLTDDTKLHLINLENQKAKILLKKEEPRRLKNRAIWLQARDGNTKFFHNFSNGRKATNTISQLPSITLPDIINLAGHFPRFVDPDEMEDMIQLVTMEELEGTLKWFKKDKSPGPDG